MKKTTLMIISVIVLGLTGFFIILGNIFAKEDYEKQTGLSEVFALSLKGKLAYVQYEDGKPTLFIADENGEMQELIDEKSAHHTISHLAFSNDGTKLLYVVNKKDSENNTTELFEYNLTDYTKQQLLSQEENIITEAVYAPDGESLYLLGAGTFENYSPIAPKNPHDFNIFRFDLNIKQLEQLTNLDSYSIGSLAVSRNGEKLYFIQDDTTNVANANEIFSSKQQIFEMEVSNPDNLSILKTVDQDITDFVFSPDEKEIVFQAVAGENKQGTYMYELFSYNLEMREAKQLTHLNEYAGRPKFSHDGSKVYFIVNFKFASTREVYAIHYLNRSNLTVKQVLKLQN